MSPSFPLGSTSGRDLQRSQAGAGRSVANSADNQRIWMTFQETAIRAALPRAQFGDASELLTRCRQVKSANEIERIQEACKITEVAWELIRRRVYPCMTVPQAERICIHSLGDAGLDPVTPGFILLDVLGYGPDFNYSKGDLFFAISATLITATKPISPVSRPSDHQAQPRADHARLQRSPGCDEAGQRCQNVAAVFNREVESPGYPRLQESKRI